MARKLPIGARQASLLDDPCEVKAEVDAEVRQARHDAPRPYEHLASEVQEAIRPQILGEWMRWGHLFAGDPDLEDRIWAPFIEGVAGHVKASVMDGPYWPSLLVRGRGADLRRMVDVPWSTDLDHVTRYRGHYFNHELRVHVALPRRLRIDTASAQAALTKHLHPRWSDGEDRMAKGLFDSVDADYITEQLDGACIFDESGHVVL